MISTQFLNTNLNDCLQAIKYLVAESYPKWPLDKDVAPIVEDNAAQHESQGAVSAPVNVEVSQQPAAMNTQTVFVESGNQTMNRDHAFHELRKIADFFAKNEPHSPVSFLLEKAIRWGYMSLPELMKELVSGNDKVLGQINLVTGISEEKAELPEYKPTAPRSENNSTDAKLSAINDKDDNSVTPTATTAPANDNTSSNISESSNNAADEEFSW